MKKTNIIALLNAKALTLKSTKLNQLNELIELTNNVLVDNIDYVDIILTNKGFINLGMLFETLCKVALNSKTKASNKEYDFMKKGVRYDFKLCTGLASANENNSAHKITFAVFDMSSARYGFYITKDKSNLLKDSKENIKGVIENENTLYYDNFEEFIESIANNDIQNI